jgi:hypothetical protein
VVQIEDLDGAEKGSQAGWKALDEGKGRLSLRDQGACNGDDGNTGQKDDRQLTDEKKDQTPVGCFVKNLPL